MSDWHERAACRGKPTDWWYPSPGAGNKVVYTEAKPICDGCPVKMECLREGAQIESIGELRCRPSIYGMRGGLTPYERSRLQSRARKYGQVA